MRFGIRLGPQSTLARFRHADRPARQGSGAALRHAYDKAAMALKACRRVYDATPATSPGQWAYVDQLPRSRIKMACYLCGAPTPAGKSVHRIVQTGTAYTGWGITKNPTVNALLSGVKRGPRRYYSLQTLCPKCAMKDAAERRTKSKGRLALIAFLFGIVIVLFILSVHK